MFKTKKSCLDADNIYVNQHTLDSFKKRNKNVNLDLSVDGSVDVNILVQRHIKNKDITALKGVVTLKDGLYLIVNIYENKKSKVLTMKTLTILTEFQLITSYNLNYGNHLGDGYSVKVSDILIEDKFFDYSVYADFLNKIKWSEKDVVFMHEDNYTPKGNEIKINIPKGDAILGIKEPYKDKKIVIIPKGM